MDKPIKPQFSADDVSLAEMWSRSLKRPVTPEEARDLEATLGDGNDTSLGREPSNRDSED